MCCDWYHFGCYVLLQLGAELAQYYFYSSQETYTPISGGTVYGSNINDNECFNDVPLGFTFMYNYQNYTSVSIASNGFIAMGTSVATSNSALSAGTTNNVIAALNRDLRSRANGELSSLLTGIPPNRVFTVQWKNYRRHPTQCINDTINFQIKLYETSNRIEFVYGSMYATNYSVAQNVQCGLRGSSNSEFLNRATTTDWTATTAGTANNATCKFNALIVPPNGYTFSWAIPFYYLPTCAHVDVPLDSSTNRFLNQTLTWHSDVFSVQDGYSIYFGTNPAPTQLTYCTMQAGTTYDPGPLASNTTYYWKIIPYNSNGEALNCPVWQFTTGDFVVPQPALNPAPANWAICNATTTQLSWQNGNGAAPVSYKVYVGTNYTPTEIVNGYVQTGTSYNLTSLTPNTTYYWSIVPLNLYGVAVDCPVWMFRTGSFIPYFVHTPVPLPDASNIALNTQLSWQNAVGEAPTEYRIYVGTNNPPTNVLNGVSTSGNSFTMTGLTANTHYYWQIVPGNSYGFAVDCPIWSFNTTESSTPGITPIELPAPEILSCRLLGGNIRLTWNPVENATAYKVYSASSLDGLYTEETEGSFIGTTWTAEIPQKQRFYKVTSMHTSANNPSGR